MDEVDATPWRFERPIGELHAGAFSGRVDVSRPHGGLHEMRLSGHKLADQILCVRRDADLSQDQPRSAGPNPAWSSPVAETYVRGNDLVASYEPMVDWPFSPQIYWRANDLSSIEGVIGSLSLLVSIQTHLLDTWPRIAAGSSVACHEALHVVMNGDRDLRAEPLTRDATFQASTGVCCFVWRLPHSPVSYAEIMPARDFREVAVQRDSSGACQTSWLLFADFLEKGVIRRSQVQSAFLRRENDLECVRRCCDAIERSSLPLTT